MAEVVTMPKLGFDMAEGVLVRWVVVEGDSVNRGEVLAEIDDLLQRLDCELAVQISVETDRATLPGLPPHSSPPAVRLDALRQIKEAGLNAVGVVAPTSRKPKPARDSGARATAAMPRTITVARVAGESSTMRPMSGIVSAAVTLTTHQSISSPPPNPTTVATTPMTRFSTTAIRNAFRTRTP